MTVNCLSRFKAADRGKDIFLIFFSWTTPQKKGAQKLHCLPCLADSTGRCFFVSSLWKNQETLLSNECKTYRKSNCDFSATTSNRTSPSIPLLKTMRTCDLMESVGRASNRNIPRGCRMKHIPGLDDYAENLLNAYNRGYTLDPFSEKTVDLVHKQLQSLGSSR